MELFDYLMAKKGHNTHRDLFSYLLGKNAGGSGTYTTFSGTSLNISNTLQAKIKNIALEGNTSQDGTPTPDTPIPIKVVTGEQNVTIQNKNLLNVLNFNSTFANVKVTTNPDKSITLNGTASSNYAINIITNWSLSLKNGKSYILSGCPDLGGKEVLSVELYSTSPTNQYITDTGDGKSFTLTVDRKYRCYIAIKSGQTYNNVKIYPMLREISTTSLFEPYQSQTYPLSLGNIELAKIGNYKDYIFKNEVGSPYYNADLELNEWYLHKEMVKVTLTENSYWYYRDVTISGTSRKVFFSRYDNLKSYNSMRNMMCNYFKVKSTEGTSPTADNQFYNNYERTNNLEFTKFDLTTVAEWKEWLSTHNIVLIGKMVNPTNTKITDTTLIQQLENINNNACSYKDTTIIECTSASTDNEVIGFSGEIKIASVSLGNSLNTSLLSSNLQEETNTNDIQEEPNLDEIEEQNDEQIENEEIEEPIEEYQEL